MVMHGNNVMRVDGRAFDQLRPLNITLSPVRYPEGSTLVELGDTHVLCAVTVEERVPSWRSGKGEGWLTAEYALLPRATQTRTPRSHISHGRAQEIRRLIGRSLRRAVDLSLLGERTFIVDCDVLQADGGTRTAAIIGGYVAIALAVQHLAKAGLTSEDILRPPVAAISAGIVDGSMLLDLAYVEDAAAQVDLNVVMDANERFIEVQGTAEGDAIPRDLVDALLDIATHGIKQVVGVQREILACSGIDV